MTIAYRKRRKYIKENRVIFELFNAARAVSKEPRPEPKKQILGYERYIKEALKELTNAGE